MADYSAWPEKTMGVTSLQLDQQNPRIPGRGRTLNPRQLIEELVKHDNVLKLAKDIAENGYLPLESLLVVEERGKTVVVEGNRRLAALKLLISPDLATEEFAPRFRKLAATISPTNFSQVKVVVAPSREAAAPIILRRHTREQVEGWSPLMQAQFYSGLVKPGVSVAKMANEHGRQPAEIGRFLRLHSMYEAACRIPLAAELAERVRNPRTFPGTVLQRLTETQHFRDFLGIELDELGVLRGRVNKSAFAKAYARVLADIVSDDEDELIDTRKLNLVTDVENYLDKTRGSYRVDQKKKGRFGLSDLGEKEEVVEEKSAENESPKPGPKLRRVGPSIVPPGTKCTASSARLRDVFGELRRVNVSKFPNSTGVLLRILLELGVVNFMRITGRDKGLLKKARERDKKPSDWYPSLRQLLGSVVEDDTVDLPPLARKAIKRLMGGQNAVFVIDDLDSYVHNSEVTLTERELRGFWNALDSLFEVVLHDPEPATPAGK